MTSTNAAETFANWAAKQFEGYVTGTTNKEKRDDSYSVEVSTDDAEGLVTYTWTSAGPPGEGAGAFFVYNMTRINNITTGDLVEAQMTFEGDAVEDWASLSKRDSASVSMTYWAASGHADTKLSYNDIADLYHHIFTNPPGDRASECGYAANSGTWHGAFKVTVSGSPDAGPCTAERKY